MSPFVIAECPNEKCKHRNRYDLAELRKGHQTVYRTIEGNEEWVVACEQCGQRFKITVLHTKQGKYGE